jgi:hypothetical protein
VELITRPNLVLDPVVREAVIDGYSENTRPILRREPLQRAENNQSVGSATK